LALEKTDLWKGNADQNAKDAKYAKTQREKIYLVPLAFFAPWRKMHGFSEGLSLGRSCGLKRKGRVGCKGRKIFLAPFAFFAPWRKMHGFSEDLSLGR
jgi:hypothetical protein